MLGNLPPATLFQSIKSILLTFEPSLASFIPRRLDCGFVSLGIEPSPILEGLYENVARVNRALMKGRSGNDGITNGNPARLHPV